MSLTSTASTPPLAAKINRSSMRKSLFVACTLLFLITFSLRVSAQESGSAAVRVDGASAAANDLRYRIGAGDVLNIQVRKAPELSGIVRVDQRGMIRIPMIEGDVQAACLT